MNTILAAANTNNVLHESGVCTNLLSREDVNIGRVRLKVKNGKNFDFIFRRQPQ